MVSFFPRAASCPYSAHAIASSSVDFPDPFAPMIPVSPVSKVTYVSRCCRKFCSRRLLSRI
jgi:hypothetical protein